MKPDWEIKKLGEVCEIIMGQSPDSDSYNTVEKGVPLINGPVEFSADAFGKTVRAKFTTLPTKYCKSGDLILCVRGSTTGRMNIAGFDACIGRGVAAIRARHYQPWINHFISSKRDEIHGKGTGSTFPNISVESLRKLQIPIPPLEEQQRIVALLDEVFAGLATAKANAEKNIQNARALFESHLQSVFSQRGPDWVEKKLGDVADSDCSLSYGIVQPGKEFDEGMPIVRPTDLTTKVICLGRLKRIDPKLAEGYKRTVLQGSELLLCVRGSTGVVSIASPEIAGANVTRGIVPIRFNRALLFPEFGFYLISSESVQRQIHEKTYGTALMQINIRDVRLISLSIPPTELQKTIVAQLDALSTETQRLGGLYERKLAALEALKRSLLHRAFNGEL